MTRSLRAVAALLLCLTGCTSSATSSAGKHAGSPTPSPTVAELTSQSCGHRANRGGPPALTPIGVRWQPSIGAYDAARLFAHSNALLAGKAAARDATWAPLASASRDLADIYETARAEYAAVLGGRATASERANLRALQAAAETALSTIRAACRRAP